jgi:hypothetical protein
MQNSNIGDSLRILASKKIVRRAKNVPRDNLTFLLPAQEYVAFHGVTKDWQRVELNGLDRQQLVGKALRGNRKHDAYLQAGLEPSRPASETRSITAWANPKQMAKFYSAGFSGACVGFESNRALGKDFVVHLSVQCKYSHNRKACSQSVRFTFGWCVYTADRVCHFYPHTQLPDARRQWIRDYAFSIPAEMRVRGRDNKGGRIIVHDDYFLHSHFDEFRSTYPAPKKRPRPTAQLEYVPLPIEKRLKGTWVADRLARLSISEPTPTPTVTAPAVAVATAVVYSGPFGPVSLAVSHPDATWATAFAVPLHARLVPF